MRKRLLVSALIGTLTGIVCSLYQQRYDRGGGDLGWSTRLVHDFIAGINPYAYPVELTPMSYPMTAAVVALPFSWMPVNIAAGVFFGLSTAVLAMGLTKDGTWWRLLALICFPYLHALQVVQWSPLLLAIGYYPLLLPIALAKPHTAFPIAMLNLTTKRVLVCAVFGLLTLIVYPRWIWDWLGHQADPGQYVPSLFILPFGPLLLLGLLRWRSKRMLYLLLMAIVPQRLFYDIFMLWFLVDSRRQMLAFAGLSWLSYFGWYFWPEVGATWVIALLYLPMLFILLREKPTQQEAAPASSAAPA